jgi:mannose-6-phosphate isomerase-like protein (cupin superfamily)
LFQVIKRDRERRESVFLIFKAMPALESFEGRLVCSERAHLFLPHYCLRVVFMDADKTKSLKNRGESKKVSIYDAKAAIPGPDNERSVQLFGHGALAVKMYAPRGADHQTPHARDEVYIVASGSGEFVSGEKREQFGPNDFLFAPAGVEHRFENFTEDFFVWVLFYGPEGGEAR